MGVSAAQGSAGLKPGVCTNTTRPSNPFEGQMIYETDTDKVLVWNGSAWYANWNTAWGIVAAPVSITTAQTGINTITDVTGATITFTGIAGRYYKATFKCSVVGTTNVVTTYSNYRFTLADGSNTAFDLVDVNNAQATDTCFIISFLFSATGSTTRKIRCTKNSGGTVSLQAAAGYPMQYYIEDIGAA